MDVLVPEDQIVFGISRLHCELAGCQRDVMFHDLAWKFCYPGLSVNIAASGFQHRPGLRRKEL